MAKRDVILGGAAPDFSLTNASGQNVQLSGILASHNAILYFVREFR